MKQFLLILLSLISFLASAQNLWRQDGLIYALYTPSDGSPYAEVTGNTILDVIDSLVIPETISRDDINYTVTSIADSAFYRNYYLRNVELPQTIKSIGNSAFLLSGSLMSINLPDSLTYIGESAFSYTSLKSITVPGGINTLNSTFFGCNLLETAIMPDCIESLGDYCFSHCKKLSKIEWPSSLKHIGCRAFQYTSLNLEESPLPEGLLSIGTEAFAYCKNLNNVILPEPLDSVGEGAFYNTMCSHVSIPGTLKVIPRDMFIKSTINSIELKEGIEEINVEAFSDVYGLHQVTLPTTMKRIGYDAFRGCGRENGYSYLSILAQSNIKYGGCSIYIAKLALPVGATVPNYASLTVQYEGKNCIADDGLAVFNSDHTAMLMAMCSLTGRYVVPESVTAIGERTFLKCLLIESIELPMGVKSIGREAFAECVSLKEIYLSSQLESLGNMAFQDCSALNKIYYPSAHLAEGPDDAFDSNTYKYAELHVAPGGLNDAYNKSPWKNFYNIVEDEACGLNQIATEGTSREIFTMQGHRVNEPLAPGLYITRRGHEVKKIIVK